MESEAKKVVGMRVTMMVVVTVCVLVGMMMTLQGVDAAGRDIANKKKKTASTAAATLEEVEDREGKKAYHPQNFLGGGVLPFPTPGFGPGIGSAGPGFGSAGPGFGSRGSSSSSSPAGGSGSSIFCNFPGVNCPGFHSSSNSPDTEAGGAGNIGAKEAALKQQP